MVAPIELVRELLYYRDMKMGTGRDWAFITAMIAGASIPFPMLAPFALGGMGVPGDLAIKGELQVSSLAEGELAVAVTGLVEHEAVAELAFHRDGGRVPVMRGTAAAPVIIEDRRLIAAALG